MSIILSRAAICLWALVATNLLWGQSRVLVSYEDAMVPIVEMRGATAIVEVDGERVMLPEGDVELEEVEHFTDGAVEITACEAMMGQDYGSPLGGFFFRFDATVEAERDFEDCFILFAIAPEQGEPTYVMREIRDIDSRGADRILVTVPVNPGFGGGAFGFKLFSKGEEIQRYEPNGPVQMVTVQGGLDEDDLDAAANYGSEAERGTGVGEPAAAVQPRLLEFPESLMGQSSGGYATAIYTIDENGNAFEFLDVAADHEEFIPEVWKTVVLTRYRPGEYNGQPLVTTVQQSFFFNEFAPFSEEMQMIPYPTIGDRHAVAAYSPIPESKVRRSIEIKVEARVDVLGRVSQVRALNDADTEAAEVAVDAVKRWIFLPAVKGGYPVEEMVVVPIRFGVSP